MLWVAKKLQKSTHILALQSRLYGSIGNSVQCVAQNLIRNELDNHIFLQTTIYT